VGDFVDIKLQSYRQYSLSRVRLRNIQLWSREEGKGQRDEHG